MHWRVMIAVLLAMITALAGAQQAPGMSPERFERELERAIELNTTAPWRESQAILDELKPHLELASDAQYAEFAYLEARNQVLSGNLEGSLVGTEDLLEHDLTPRQRIRAYRLAANVAVLARRFEAAFRYLREGLQLLGERDRDLYSEGLYGLASYTYAQVGEVERGLEFAELAMEQARNHDNMRDVCYAEQRFAFVHKFDGNIDAARSRYRNAVANCLEAGDVLSAAVSQSGLADLLRRANEYDAAEQHFEGALERPETVDYKSGVAEASLYYARLEHARGRPERVVDLLEPVMKQLRTSQTWDYLAEAHRMLGDIARERGDYPRALDHYEARLDAREKHLDMERARRIAARTGTSQSAPESDPQAAAHAVHGRVRVNRVPGRHPDPVAAPRDPRTPQVQGPLVPGRPDRRQQPYPVLRNRGNGAGPGPGGRKAVYLDPG